MPTIAVRRARHGGRALALAVLVACVCLLIATPALADTYVYSGQPTQYLWSGIEGFIMAPATQSLPTSNQQHILAWVSTVGNTVNLVGHTGLSAPEDSQPGCGVGIIQSVNPDGSSPDQFWETIDWQGNWTATWLSKCGTSPSEYWTNFDGISGTTGGHRWYEYSLGFGSLANTPTAYSWIDSSPILVEAELEGYYATGTTAPTPGKYCYGTLSDCTVAANGQDNTFFLYNSGNTTSTNAKNSGTGWFHWIPYYDGKATQTNGYTYNPLAQWYAWTAGG